MTQSAQPPYNVCLIGLGRHGLKQLHRLAENPAQWRLAAVVDRSVAAYARFQYHFHSLRVPFYRDAVEAIRSEPIDVIIISTTAPSHVPIAESLIRGGYEGGLLIEKPISDSIARAEDLQHLIEEAAWPGRVAVDFNRRCSELYRRVKSVHKSGECGAIIRLEFNRPCKLSMVGMHFIDLANWIIGSRPIEVSGRLDMTSIVDHRGAVFYDPPGWLQVRYASGAIFEMNTMPDAPPESLGMTVWFEQGKARINNDESLAVIETPAGEDRVEVTDENRRYRWIESALASVVEASAGCEICPLPEAILALEVVAAVHHSNSMDGAIATLPLPQEVRNRRLRIA
ncbi:MAG: Gfo/Idh/MocA family oxidoreductase [Chloroflexi bacterium]|nr:Gfo/Idh/MocA family oxidoreductase [Chloroflexota bacterium]